MKIGFLQYDVTHHAEKNIECIMSALQKHSFEVLVLPELSICGYLFSSRNELLACAESIFLYFPIYFPLLTTTAVL